MTLSLGPDSCTGLIFVRLQWELGKPWGVYAFKGQPATADAVAGLVGIEGGVVSGVFNLEIIRR